MKTKEELIAEVKKTKWEKWLLRPYGGLGLSLFRLDTKSAELIGFPGITLTPLVYQDGYFYRPEDKNVALTKYFEKYFQEKTIFEVIKSFEEFYSKTEDILLSFTEDESTDPVEQLKTVVSFIRGLSLYVVITHNMELALTNIFCSKLSIEDYEKLVEKAQSCIKKTAQDYLDDELRKGTSHQEIAKEFAWLRIRDSVDDPFTVEDIKELAENVIEEREHIIPEVADEHKEIFEQLREMIYFRTRRINCFYKMLFLARPIFRRVAKKYGFPFPDIGFYPLSTLVSGKLEKIEPSTSAIYFPNQLFFFDEKFIVDQEIDKDKPVKGQIAFKGKVQGTVKVILAPKDLPKIDEGDILVTQMTFPSFIMAMKKAAAFVTDEGGITCHAAIVAREMKKPCLIATKIATQVFKDGDLVEVDAENGVVKRK
jgi:phosphohistidine swiveling domain-containing protein